MFFEGDWTLLILGIIVLAIVYAVVHYGGTATTPAATPAASADVIKQKVGNAADLQVNEMKEIQVQGKAVLLVKADDERVYALGARCPHMGAKLIDGVMHQSKVRCPWHGAAFDVTCGDIEEYPCSDALQSHTIEQSGDGELLLSTTRDKLQSHKRAVLAKYVASGKASAAVAVIVGAGTAGGTCAEALRQYGFAGRVVLIGDEQWLPYDRTKLSKALSSKGERLQTRSKAFYESIGVELWSETRVLALDAKAKTLSYGSEKRELAYDYCVLATGGAPRTLPIPGFSLGNVFQLRTPRDANGIHAAVNESTRVVIIGSSFIGMEAAAAVARRARSVCVIGMEKVPFERVLGTEIGARFQELHESHGVQFHMQRTVREIVDDKSGKVCSVVLDNGEELDADVCIVGAGVVPSTQFVSGIEKQRDHSILCDATLHAGNGLYAAGDVARFPYEPLDMTIRVEHYGYAQQQGRVCAANIAGVRTECKSVPFFWTSQFGKHIRYAGHAIGYNRVIIDGDLNALDFTAIYARDEKVLAVATMGRDQEAAAAAELMQANKMPKASAWDQKEKKKIILKDMLV